MSKLHKAAKSGDLQEVLILLEQGESVDAKDVNKYTPLHMAALYKHFKIVKLLVGHGADVNAQSDQNVTPLHFAFDNFEILACLLAHEANPNIQNILKELPLHNIAVRMGVEYVKLMLHYNSEIDSKAGSQERTPLMYAANYKNFEAIETLVTAGANINLQDFQGNTALRLACQNGDKKSVEFLVQHGANIDTVSNWMELPKEPDEIDKIEIKQFLEAVKAKTAALVATLTFEDQGTDVVVGGDDESSDIILD